MRSGSRILSVAVLVLAISPWLTGCSTLGIAKVEDLQAAETRLANQNTSTNAEVKKVKIVTDIGDLDVVIGKEGKVAYEATSLRATGSQEDLDRATAVPFPLEHVPFER